MFLQEKDFSFTVLNQHRKGTASVGTSGELLLADNGSEKYVVKYLDPFDAATEYMAITIAEKLRLNCTPSAHLFYPSERFPHAIGIQYLPDICPPQSKEGVLKCIILNFLIANGDHMEIGEYNGHIYTLDFGESFCFDYHHKTEDFLAKCRAAHTDKAVREQVLPLWEADYNRYLHILGYANEINFLETAQKLAEDIDQQPFTREEVHNEWTHVWRRLIMLKDNAFEEMRTDLETIYGPLFAAACYAVLHGLVGGMRNVRG